MLYHNLFQPKRNLPVQQNQQAAQQGDKEPEGPPRVALDAALPELTPPGAEEEAAAAAQTPPFVSLGSVDPDGPYRMAAVFDTRGATIRRLTLAKDRYGDLDDRSGTLGPLELSDAAGGARVEVVVPGTPAEAAGLEAGDVLKSIVLARGGSAGAEQKITKGEDLNEYLARSKPGHKVTVNFERSGKAMSVEVALTERQLDLIVPEAENILLHEDALPNDFEVHPSLEVTIENYGPREVEQGILDAANKELTTGVWLVTQLDDDTLEFRKTLRDLRVEVVKRLKAVQVPKELRDDRNFAAYHLEFDLEFRNLSTEPQRIAYRVQGPNGLPVEGWWYAQKVGRTFSAYGIRDIVLRYHGMGAKDYSVHKISRDKVPPIAGGGSLAFVATDAQYFAAAMLPRKESKEDRWYAIVEPNLASTRLDVGNNIKVRYNNASFALTSYDLELAPAGTAGDQQGHASTLFAGPKYPALLDQYRVADGDGQTLEPLVYYGYAGSLYIPQAMVKILTFFYNIVGNYGIAIILLTVLVRGMMFPLSRKQAKSMMKMQALKPEMDRIAAKYKDDLQARGAAQRELMAKHNCNPLGGCWLMFLQLPIFIGLYRALMVDVELRQAALIPGIRWCSNLAAPDMLYDWSWIWPDWFNNGEGIFALGPYFNILPLATVGLFLVQQKMFMPPPTDEQTRMTQKVMQYMMIFMAFMFFKVAAGLCIYFIASSVWGIVERSLLSPVKNGDGEAGGAVSNSTSVESPGASLRRQKIEAAKSKRNAKRKR